MATTGTVDVNLTKFSEIINNSTLTGAETVASVADQGELIGLGVSLQVAFGLLIMAALFALGIVLSIFAVVRKFKKAGKS